MEIQLKLSKDFERCLEELKDKYGIDIDKRKIQVSEPIKTFGKYELTVKYYQDISGKLNLIVTEKE